MQLSDEDIRAELSEEEKYWYNAVSAHGRSGSSVFESLALARRENRILKKDQEDWRRGVALIGQALGYDIDNDLSCVGITKLALEKMARLEKLARLLNRAEGQSK